MNVPPTAIENSMSPFHSQGASGDLMDRMHGNLPNTANGRFADLKKAGSDNQGSNFKGIPGSLQMFSPNNSSIDKTEVTKPKVESSASSSPPVDLEKIKSDPCGDKSDVKKKRARKKWKKPKDKPNRPLSAYNLFFQAQRASMLGDSAKVHDQDKAKKRVHRKTHGKVGFAEMARIVGQKWKGLPEDDRKPFLESAAIEKKRYATELDVWKELQKTKAKGSKTKVARLRGESQAEMDDSSSGIDAESNDDLRRLMQDGANRRNLSLIQARRADNEYLRVLQERQMAILAGRSNTDSYPSASEASANAILQQFQNPMGGAGFPGMNQMGMNPVFSGMSGMNAMNMNGMGAMNMNNMNMSMNMMNELQQMGPSQRQAQLDAADRLQQLRGGYGGLPGHMGDMGNMGHASAGMGSSYGGGGFGSSQGDLGLMQQQFSSQYPGNNDMAAAMARRFQNRYNM